MTTTRTKTDWAFLLAKRIRERFITNGEMDAWKDIAWAAGFLRKARRTGLLKGIWINSQENEGFEKLLKHYEELVARGVPESADRCVHVLFEAYGTFLRQLRMIKEAANGDSKSADT